MVNDEIEQIEIDEKVLAKLILGRQAAGLHQLAEDGIGLAGAWRFELFLHFFIIASRYFTIIFPKRSVSRLTVAGGCFRPSVVRSIVCGIRATLKPSAVT